MPRAKSNAPDDMFKNVHSNWVLMLNIPTQEDCLRVYKVLSECHDAKYSRATIVNAWKATGEKTVVMFIREGGLYTRVVGDGTYESYRAGLMPLEDFYKKYDKSLIHEEFNNALKTLEESLQ